MPSKLKSTEIVCAAWTHTLEDIAQPGRGFSHGEVKLRMFALTFTG